MNQQKVDILYVSDKLVITCLPRTLRLIFSSFLILCTHWQNMKNSKNIGACLKNPLFSDPVVIETIY